MIKLEFSDSASLLEFCNAMQSKEKGATTPPPKIEDSFLISQYRWNDIAISLTDLIKQNSPYSPYFSKKHALIKAFRSITGAGLKEAKEHIERYFRIDNPPTKD